MESAMELYLATKSLTAIGIFVELILGIVRAA